MKNFIIGIIAIAALAGGVVWFLSQGNSTPENTLLPDANTQVVADPVATVNGETITAAEFTAQQSLIATEQGIDMASLDAETKASLSTYTVDSLISQKLLKQAVEQSDIVVTDAEVEAQIEEIKGRFGSEEEYAQALAAEELTEEALKEDLKAELAIAPYLEQELNLSAIEASEEEITALYEQTATSQEVPPLEEVRESVMQAVIQQKQQQAVNDHVAELRTNANVEIHI